MNKMSLCLRRFYQFLLTLGIDPIKLFSFGLGLPVFIKDLFVLKGQLKTTKEFPLRAFHPILSERLQAAGTMSGHYFHQDLFVARKIFERKPIRHVDIGSRIDGFVAHLAVFRQVEVFDIRTNNNTVENITFRQADLIRLPKQFLDYCDSISSLHAIEHFGLGRYGDPIDANGHVKAIENISRILKTGGVFYLSVPIGPQRIEFNAHRVFSIQYLLGLLENRFTLQSFSYVDDLGNFHESAPLAKGEIELNFGCNFGCGIFELKKK